MTFEFVLALFVIGVGISVAGAGTHFYQLVSGEKAMLRFDGESIFSMFGHLIMSFVCGPYIMIMMGLQKPSEGESAKISQALLAAFVAFGWSFITGLLFLGIYFAVIG